MDEFAPATFSRETASGHDALHENYDGVAFTDTPTPAPGRVGNEQGRSITLSEKIRQRGCRILQPRVRLYVWQRLRGKRDFVACRLVNHHLGVGL